MASSASTSPLRRLLEDRLAQLSDEADHLYRERAEQACRHLVEQLNQSARRMRRASDTEELAATLADAAAPFASGIAIFCVESDAGSGQAVAPRALRGLRIRGVPEEAAERFRSLHLPLSSAPALAGGVETRDPVTAAASAAEVSPEMMELAGHAADARVSIFPLVAHDRVRALLYTWGDVQAAGAELVAQVAAAVWAALEAPPREAANLVQIAGAATGDRAHPPDRSWHDLPPAEQRIHLRAQRFARVRAAGIRLREAHAVQVGRARRDLYGALRNPIDAARQEFHSEFFAACPSMVDYLHLELVRALANDDAELLGKDYPGPLL